MTIAMLVSKLKQFCLWFFWDMNWPKEKIIILGALILVLFVLTAIVKRFKKPAPVAKTTAASAGQKRHWRTG
ncbi:MAG TPA: hypothetical protein VMX13_06895 [Sedimentisphaerales bacterium]|nr:hypothetical protein [Sedimentisphaerales bacterium]